MNSKLKERDQVAFISSSPKNTNQIPLIEAENFVPKICQFRIFHFEKTAIKDLWEYACCSHIYIYIYIKNETFTGHGHSLALLQFNFLSSMMTQTTENGVFGTGDIPYLEPHLVYSRTAEFGRATIALRYTLIWFLNTRVLLLLYEKLLLHGDCRMTISFIYVGWNTIT